MAKVCLLIEDNEPVALVYSRALQQEGFAVVITGCVESAVLFMQTERFDVVITDIALPGGSALELLPELRRATSAPVIAITGYDVEREDIRKAGFDAAFQKPVSVPELAETIRRLTDERRREGDA